MLRANEIATASDFKLSCASAWFWSRIHRAAKDCPKDAETMLAAIDAERLARIQH